MGLKITSHKEPHPFVELYFVNKGTNIMSVEMVSVIQKSKCVLQLFGSDFYILILQVLLRNL